MGGFCFQSNTMAVLEEVGVEIRECRPERAPELGDLHLARCLQHHFAEGFHMRELVAALPLKQEDFFVSEKVSEVAHGEFTFVGARTRELIVVGAGADGDSEPDGDVVEKQCAIRRSGGDVHASA